MSTGRRPLSRRQFLKGAAALAGAPVAIASAALGAAPAPAAPKRLGLGLIGGGRRGVYWITALGRSPAVQFLAVADVDDRSGDRAMRYAARYRHKACQRYKDFREVLARPDIDAVIVATPDHWHALCTIAAMKAGKDVYCESPLSLTIREAREMANVARRYGRVVQTGTHYRSSSHYRAACELVAGGRIGQVSTVHVQAGHPSRQCLLGAQPVPPQLDWNMWLGPAPWAPYNSLRCGGASSGGGWQAWRDYSGGTMAYLGAHYFDAIHWALGLDETGPVEIVPADAKAKKPLTLRYESNLTIVVGRTPHEAVIEFVGDDGSLGIGVGRGGYQTWPEELAKEPVEPNEAKLQVSNDHMGDFLACVKSRRRPISDVAVACRSVTVSHLCNLATWLDRPIRWDPATEQITGDGDAARWLDRPRRAPWRL